MHNTNTISDKFRAKTSEASMPVQDILPTCSKYRAEGNQVLDQILVVGQHLADIVALGGETEFWSAIETRPVDRHGELDLSDTFCELLPEVTFVKRAGTV
jgi:hypothetical protein